MPLRKCCWVRVVLLAFLTASGFANEIEEAIQHDRQHSSHDPGIAHYVSRPDLQVPKWNVKTHLEGLASPGYIFVAPYKHISGQEGDKPWVGPFIYDGRGELVWSGASMFSSNIEDFRVSNVTGEELLTLMTHKEAYVLDKDYSVRTAMSLANGGFMNTHDLNFIHNGTRALFLSYGGRQAPAEEARRIGFEGPCKGEYDGFQERDVTRDGWPSVFDWTSFGKIGLEESTMTDYGADYRCKGWDHIHSNAIDKTPDGDYLFSGRHTDTIYKISGRDGSIIWRLGGVKSSFPIPDDLVFSRQHDVRCRGQNSTHLLLSILDNSVGQDSREPTHDFSRGLLIAIDEKNMQASLEQHYDHPWHQQAGLAWAPRRGNFQLLPNGNVFMGFSERGIQGEYTPDGQLIWEAVLQVDWMGSYRNYKFDNWVGQPRESPTAVARARNVSGVVETTVHVSWNGATEVERWKLYRTSPDGWRPKVLVGERRKMGFETRLNYTGFAGALVVDAVDKQGFVIGRTLPIKTGADASISEETMAAGEEAWLRKQEKQAKSKASVRASKSAIALFLVGMLCGALLLLGFGQMRHHGLRALFQRQYFGRLRYTAIPQ